MLPPASNVFATRGEKQNNLPSSVERSTLNANPTDSWHSGAELGPFGLGGGCLVGTSEVMEEAPNNEKSIRHAYINLVEID